jgi:hypothetical protein
MQQADRSEVSNAVGAVNLRDQDHMGVIHLVQASSVELE